MIQHWTALSLKAVGGVRSGHTWGVAAVTDTIGDVRVQVSDVHSKGRSPGDSNVGIIETNSFHFSWGVQYSCTKEETEPVLMSQKGASKTAISFEGDSYIGPLTPAFFSFRGPCLILMLTCFSLPLNLWNSLPPSLHSCDSVITVKRALLQIVTVSLIALYSIVFIFSFWVQFLVSTLLLLYPRCLLKDY